MAYYLWSWVLNFKWSYFTCICMQIKMFCYFIFITPTFLHSVPLLQLVNITYQNNCDIFHIPIPLCILYDRRYVITSNISRVHKLNLRRSLYFEWLYVCVHMVRKSINQQSISVAVFVLNTLTFGYCLNFLYAQLSIKMIGCVPMWCWEINCWFSMWLNTLLKKVIDFNLFVQSVF